LGLKTADQKKNSRISSTRYAIMIFSRIAVASRQILRNLLMGNENAPLKNYRQSFVGIVKLILLLKFTKKNTKTVFGLVFVSILIPKR
jgi:hypothetical protein